MDNLLLYRSLFKGREDVYAIHWSKGTKSGYMPAKLYDPYISKVYKKSTNPNNSETANYLPLTDDQIQRHLEGRQLTGLYPLLQDNTSWLIAADFDKKSWLEDCRSFITICASYNIPAYLERSRSGKGGHVWIFFNQPYPAFKSRIIVLTLLERAGIVSTFDKNSSFDRLFPNQDKHSGKGFGNLIALPLYKPTLELGNSCFIESETALPYRNQWEFLSSIRRISINDLDQIFLSLTSSKSLNVIEPGKLVIKLSNTIEINRNGISTALASFLKDELNFFNPDFIIKKNLFKKGNLLGKNVEMFQLSAGDANQTLYESGEELLKDVLIRGNYRHKIQLRYLSDLHLGNVLKIRFVLSPFAFVFLLTGKEQYHIVMETLDTDEATYIWHTSKEVSELKNALHNVDKDLNKIRNDGRFAFLQSVPINFSRVFT
ncbi:hypothetical protein WAE58_02915 [Pedobacter panaciterrae]|uniref:TOTE conflict system primase domain-containing protein n=1 Tax=Pedobacter panaciterrae TaxID=363849 RepID=A0ABU8NHK3_9SPHI